MMTLSGDDIVEASLLKPMAEEHGTFLTPEECKLLSWVRKYNHHKFQVLSQNDLEIPKFVEPVWAKYHS